MRRLNSRKQSTKATGENLTIPKPSDEQISSQTGFSLIAAQKYHPSNPSLQPSSPQPLVATRPHGNEADKATPDSGDTARFLTLAHVNNSIVHTAT